MTCGNDFLNFFYKFFVPCATGSAQKEGSMHIIAKFGKPSMGFETSIYSNVCLNGTYICSGCVYV